MKKVKTTFCTLSFRLVFTLWHRHVSEKSSERVSQEKKCAADKTVNRAGATPLFRLSAAQKVLGVAPALGTTAGAFSFVRRAGTVSEVGVSRSKHNVHHQESTSHSHA